MLLDTGILFRFLDESSQYHLPVKSQVVDLLRSVDVHISPQSIYEMAAICGRPVNVGGLDYEPLVTDQLIERALKTFHCAQDPSSLLPTWRETILEHQVRGRQIHDSRLVAYMKCIGIGSILTLNPSDFKRYGVTVLSPEFAS